MLRAKGGHTIFNSDFSLLYDVDKFRKLAVEVGIYNDSKVANKIEGLSDSQLQEMINSYIDQEEISKIVNDAFTALINKLEQEK